MRRYYFTAAVLGAGWFLVLLLPRMTRELLLASAWMNLVWLMLSSVLIAHWGRGYIGRASTWWEHCARAVLLPYVGCVVFLTLYAGWLWARTLLGGGMANLHDTLSLYAMGLTAAVLSFVVVVPYGFCCQYLLSSILRSTET